MHPETINFLTLLSQNNTRNFFGIIKPLYEQVWEQFLAFTNQIISQIQTFDDAIDENLQAKQCVFRIYRDARRLKEGDPVYKTNLGMSISPNGKNDTRAGYYLHIQPGQSFFGGGVYWPESEELLNLRHYLAKHGDEYNKIISHKAFVRQFGQIHGECLTRPPRGFTQDHPHLELIMRKQHLITRKYSDTQILDSQFIKTFIEDCRLAMPFFHFLNTGYTYTARQHEL